MQNDDSNWSLDLRMSPNLQYASDTHSFLTNHFPGNFYGQLPKHQAFWEEWWQVAQEVLRE